MIIRHSLKILEQLSEIESLIQKIELIIEDENLEVDREKILLKILKKKSGGHEDLPT